MLNGMWKGKKYIATDIEKDYSLEKEIREASRNGEIYCPDPNCNNPIKYCNGRKRKAYFAHIGNNCCDYASFDKEDKEEIKLARLALFEHFKKLNYDVQLEVKVANKRYAHLLFNMPDKTKIVLQICTKRNYIHYMETLTSDFALADVKVCWIVLTDSDGIFQESNTYCDERAMFYETKNKELVAINLDCTTVFQCKKDTNEYCYKGETMLFPLPYTKIFNYKGNISQLTFINNELSMVGFDETYKVWLDEKKKFFDDKIEELSKKEILRKEQMSSNNNSQKNYKKKKRKSFEEYTAEDFKKQKEFILKALRGNYKQRLRDYYENVWLICKECKDVKPLFEFEIVNESAINEEGKYNYPNDFRFGYCKECKNKK